MFGVRGALTQQAFLCLLHCGEITPFGVAFSLSMSSSVCTLWSSLSGFGRCSFFLLTCISDKIIAVQSAFTQPR